MFFILAIFMVGTIFTVDFAESEETVSSGKIFAIIKEKDSHSLWVRDNEKKYLERFARKVKNVVYREATLHNPKGDLLPDSVDDNIINELKSRIN